MSERKKPAVQGGVLAVKEGRRDDYSEDESINVDFNSKLYYIYREVILLLLISFSQDEVSSFIFEGNDNITSLNRFFNKVGTIKITEFDKVVWFLVNSQNYVSGKMELSFFKNYNADFLKSSVFNIIHASKSFSIIICRFLYTIIKTNQSLKGLGGGMKRSDTTPEVGHKHDDKEEEEDDESDNEELVRRPSNGFKRDRNEQQSEKAIDISQFNNIIDNPDKYIVDNCETIEKVLDESYLNLDNIDPTPEDYTDNHPPPVADADAENTNESKINVNNTKPILIRDGLYERVLSDLNPTPQELFFSASATATTEPEPGKRKCSRFVLLAEAKKREEEERLDEANKKKEIALQLAIKAKQELDEAISKAGGETYKGIKTIAGTFYPKVETETIDIPDSKLIPILAMKQKSIEQGARDMLMKNDIPNKVSAVSILAKLNIISASDDINDEEDNQGGGGHSNYNQYGNAGPHIPKTKKHRLKDSDIGQKVKVAVAGVRESLEGIGAQNQCNAAIGSISQIPRIKCYICGQLGGMPNMKTMECEHIFCVGLAAQYFGLLRATSFSEEQKRVLSILYAWAHRCCNQLKSNLSFMKFKDDPNEGFVFHEANARELLRNIYGNTVKYDCEWVDKLIKKVYPEKQRFIATRTPVLGRYCRPLIDQINDVRSQLFHFSPELFSFMSILKIAATTLVLLTGETKETHLKLKSKETVPLCRLLLFKDLESRPIVSKRGRARVSNGGGRKNNKIQYGGVFDDSRSIEDIYNYSWGQLMKSMIRSHAQNTTQERPEPVDENPATVLVRFIIEYADSNRKTLRGDTQLSVSTTNEQLVNIVNKSLFVDKLEELQPYGDFYIVHPITNEWVLIQGSLGDTIGNINNPAVSSAPLTDPAITGLSSVPLPVPTSAGPAAASPVTSSEQVIPIYYLLRKNGPGPDTVVVPNSLNVPIFNLLALNHKINPYSLIVALLYDNVSAEVPDVPTVSAEDHSSKMLQSINVITNGFVITDEYKREQLSVTLLIMLLIQPTTPLPHQITTHFDKQTAILDRIKDKLFNDISKFDEPLQNALNAILLIVHPDELPHDDDGSKDDELIQDILSFIYCENKNTLYKGLIENLGITDLTVFKPAELKEEEHDGKLDEDDEESVSGGPAHTEPSFMESDFVKEKTIKNRIRNLLIVIGGVYLVDDGGLDNLNRIMYNLIKDTSKFPKFKENFEKMRQEIPQNKRKHEELHIFLYLINLLIEQPHESNNILSEVFKGFLGQKLVLFKPESPLSPQPMEGNFDSPGYDPSVSAMSEDDSSQLLSPLHNPPPHENMREETANKIIESSLEFISSHSGTCVFDKTTLQEYIDYFNYIVLEDGNQVLLRTDKPRYQLAIEYILGHHQPSSDYTRYGGSKTNKKKLTKRRLVQRRLYKQYSKNKRNTSSNKKKKRVSIKHKRSRTKYHDTRKRRK